MERWEVAFARFPGFQSPIRPLQPNQRVDLIATTTTASPSNQRQSRSIMRFMSSHAIADVHEMAVAHG
jgi:hypothetical protein